MLQLELRLLCCSFISAFPQAHSLSGPSSLSQPASLPLFPGLSLSATFTLFVNLIFQRLLLRRDLPEASLCCCAHCLAPRAALPATRGQHIPHPQKAALKSKREIKHQGLNGRLGAECFFMHCPCNFPLCFKENDFTKNRQRKKIKFKASGNEPSFQC